MTASTATDMRFLFCTSLVFFLCFSLNTIGCLAAGDKVMICYWGTWSHYRNDTGKFSVEQIDPSLCTHIVYAFMGLDKITFEMKYLDPWLDLEENWGLGMIKKTVNLRNQNSNLKILIAIGGWNEGSESYSEMSADPLKRQRFISSVLRVIRTHDFDGIDMDWEYPANRGGLPEDIANFPILLKELREALDAETRPPGRDNLLLTSAFGCGEKTVESAYDVPEIAKYVDYFHLMLYDFKVYLGDDGAGGHLIGHHSPLYYKEWEDSGNKSLSVRAAVENYISKGAPPEKLVLGVGTYGKSFALSNPQSHDFYDEAIGPGLSSNYTNENGTMGYYEICLEILEEPEKWRTGFDWDYMVPYAYSDTKWVGFDDEISAKYKVDFAMEKGLAGMMIWSLETDDFRNVCGGWNAFPILTALNERLNFHSKKKPMQT